MPHAGLAADRGCVQERPSDEHEVRAERQRLQHVGAAADAAVEHHRHAARGFRDLRQHPQRRDRAVELAAAVVRHHDAVDAVVLCGARVGDGQNALDHERPLPAPADQLDVLPRQLIAVADRALEVARDHRRAAGRIQVLEMRHAVLHDGARKRADRPARMGHHVPDELGARLDRNAEAGSHVVLAVGRDRYVHGQHEHLVARGGDAIDQRFDARGIARQIGLVPGGGARGANLLEPDQRSPAQDHRNVCVGGGLCEGEIAAVGADRGGAHRGDAERRGVGAAEQHLGVAPPRDVDEVPRDERVILIAVEIGLP